MEEKNNNPATLQELSAVMKQGFSQMATKEDLKAIRNEMATKEDLKLMATKDDLKGLATQAALSTVMEAVAETKESVTEMKGIMQDMLEEMNAMHDDTRSIRSRVDALVRNDIAQDVAIENLASQVQQLKAA
ncbi:MAG: hypothetical protein HY007_04470 [Candidatus Sungbacteria bacterium]|nr:hypothetical protein [Candidatus Sungbacteria bacterium]